MRRILGAAVVVLGALFIGFGLLAKPYLYDRLAVVPLDQDSESVSEGTDMDVLYPHVVDGKPAIDALTGVDVRSTRTIKGIPGAVEALGVEDDQAFWQTTVRSQAQVDGQYVDLSYSDAGVSFDRHTGEATNCCGDYASAGDLTDPDKVEPRTYEGLYFKFPFDVQQQDYTWWDSAVQRADPITFMEEQEIDGVSVYRFQQRVGPEVIDVTDVPTSLFSPGADGNTTADVVYSNTRTLWVEPVTGVLIDGNEDVSLTYEAEGYEPVGRTVGSIGFNAETVADNAATWGPKASLLSFIDNWLTLVGVAVGLVLVALGGALILTAPAPNRGRPASRQRTDEDLSFDEIAGKSQYS